MIKNQEIKGTFTLVPPFFFSLFASIYFVHVLDALSRNHIIFFSVISFNVTRCQTVDTVFLKKSQRILNQKLKGGSVQKSDAVMA